VCEKPGILFARSSDVGIISYLPCLLSVSFGISLFY